MEAENEGRFDYDVVIVGGGPAGCSTGVFTARYGLETVIFDRGSSSLRQYAHLENYLGFPTGIDIDTFYALAQDHAEEAGCELVSDMVENVALHDDGAGFVVETQDGRRVTARRVVAATRYDGEYLRGLDDDAVMFDSYEVGDEEHEYFSRSYADSDGRTPIEGLYIAGPIDAMSRQAITAAGHGALVGRYVVGDARRDDGYWDEIADRSDWVRQESALDAEWSSRDRLREWVENNKPDDLEVDERFIELREAEIDRRFASYLSDEEIEERTERAHDRLLEHIDTARIRAYLDRVDEEATNAE